jgi:hypothetical protein
VHSPTANRYPRVQIVTLPEKFDGKRPNMPTVILPYINASPRPQFEALWLVDQADNDDQSGPFL